MSLVTVVTGGLVSTFAIFDRVQTAWRDRNQARALSVVAEEAIVRDARVYQVVSAGNRTLVLSSPVDGNGSKFTVSYSVSSDSKNELRRTVVGGDGKQLSQTVVAHGINDMTASCSGHPGVVHVELWVVPAGSSPQDKPIKDEPGFDVASRNPVGAGCS